MKIVIIGGVAGGMSAATRLRRLDESAEIVVLERGTYVSFANCGLPYYVGGVIESRGALLLQTPESLAARFRLDVRVHHEVIGIDRRGKSVQVSIRGGAARPESYDVLILAAGATALAAIPGHGVPTHTLRTVDDVDAIAEVLDNVDSEPRVVVIGAGFIGLEAVENLVRRGARVTLVQRGSRPLSPLDPEMAEPILTTLFDHGVDVRLNTTVAAVSPGLAHLEDGSTIAADLIVEARGVRPDTHLAREAGLAIGEAGGIAVNGIQRTSDPFIYAVGDAAEKVDAIDGSARVVTMAGLANRHGRTAADAIAGATDPGTPSLGTAIVGLFGLTIAMVGWSEARLTAARRPHRVIHTHPSSHAGYYPGAEQMTMKLLVDRETDAILGAQIIGGAGVDKRIDVIATAMTGGLTASQLSRLELAYAPQYGSAKDPVNMLGYVADNLASGLLRNVQWHELGHVMEDGAVLIDVRSSEEFERGAIPGARNIPLDDIRARIDELPDAPLVVHCQVGQRGHSAARLLGQLGHDVRNLDGGYRTWLAGTAAAQRPTAGAHTTSSLTRV